MGRALDQAPERPAPRFTIKRLPLDSWDERPWKVRDELAPHWIGHASSHPGALRVALFAAISRRRKAGEAPTDAVGERVAIDIAVREAEREAEAKSEARIREKIWREEDAIRRVEAEKNRDSIAAFAWRELTAGRP